MNEIPEWANWVAKFKSGGFYVFEEEPKKLEDLGIWIIKSGRITQVENSLVPYPLSWGDEYPITIQHMKIKNDLVNKPNHYNVGGIETIDIIKSMLTEEEFKGYLKGNILKYRERAEHKGNAEQDYAKAKKYFDWLEELE